MWLLLYFSYLLQTATPGAAPQNDVPQVRLGQEFTLPLSGRIVLTDSLATSLLYLSLESILDSRCPSDVNCIQAGSADLQLSCSTLGGAPIPVRISLAGNPKVQHVATYTFAVQGTAYTLRLLDVAPYPTANGLAFPKHARMVLAKK